jgi:hypothetical protein
MQRADDHVEAARGKSGRDDPPAEAVDELLERNAAQTLVDDPSLNPRQLEWRCRMRGSNGSRVGGIR